MKKNRSDGQETRQKLLAAAAEIFAKKGFWETTHVDICGKAETNIAAVNYHFGSKETLYIEAWKYSFQKSIAKYPPDGGISPHTSVYKRLRGRILAFMQRVADPESNDFDIMHKEMANPTGLLDDTIEKATDPLEEDMKSIFQELLGDKVSEKQIRFCRMSVMGQCFGPMLHLRHSRSNPPVEGPRKMPLDFRIEELAEHIISFSLAGMKSIRKDAEKTKKKSHKE